MAMGMAWRLKDYGVTLEDLQQEACLGLCEAALRFDETAENNFAAYARHWCRKMMLEAINRYGAPMQLPPAQRREMRFYSLNLDQNNQDEDDNKMADRLQDGISIDQDNSEMLRQGQLLRLDDALTTLSPQEQDVVRMLHGLGGEPMTMQEVGMALGFSKQHISKIHQSALRKLNDALAQRPLDEYLAPWM